MHKQDCFYLGTIVGKFSFRGEVLIKLDTDQPEIYVEKESIFVEVHNDLIPFFIEESRLQKSALLRVRFEGIHDEKTAGELVGKDVFLPLTELPMLDDDQFYYHEVIGYQMKDKKFGQIGMLKNINDSTPQALFEIDHNGKEILIPVNDNFIKKIDKPRQTITLEVPEGLIEMYL